MDFRSALQAAGLLGGGILLELEKVHELLAQLERNKVDIRGLLRILTDRAFQFDMRHDRKARGLNYIIRGLIEIADEDAKIEQRRVLLDRLFPTGLAVTQLPYTQESGAAVALERTVTPEVRAELAAIVVDSIPLDKLFDEWMAAARDLGGVVRKRTELVAKTSRDGSGGHAFDQKATRAEWIRVVRGLLWTLDAKPELAPVREIVMASLVQEIAAAQRTPAGVLEEDVEDELVEGDVDDEVEGLDDTVDGDAEGEQEQPVEPVPVDPELGG